MEMQTERIKWKQQVDERDALIEVLKKKTGFVDCVATQDDAKQGEILIYFFTIVFIRF